MPDSLRHCLSSYVSAIRPPTVPAGGSRLRITFSGAHQEEDIERLLEACRQAIDKIRHLETQHA